MLRSNNMNMANGRAFDRVYSRLERAAVAAARRNDAMLLYVPETPGAVLMASIGISGIATPGDPIGRLPDMQYGPPRLGPELITNGTFSNGLNGWSDGSTSPAFVAVVSGQCVLTRTDANNARLDQPVQTTPGKTYLLTVDVSSMYVTVAVGSTQGGSGVLPFSVLSTGAGRAITFTATTSTSWIRFLTGGVGTPTLDNVSVRELIDPAGSRSAELLTNGNFASWAADNPTGWGLSFTETATEYVTQASPGARLVSANGVFNELKQDGVSPVGRTFEIIVVVTACAGAGCVSNGSQTPITFTAPGVYRAVFTSILSTIGLKRSIAGQACDFTVSSISLREVFGYHCTQATAASKPTLARIARRLGPELLSNGTFADLSGWTGYFGAAAAVGGRLRLTEDADGTGVRAKCLLATRPGASYQVQADCIIGTGTGAVVAAVAGDNTAYGTSLGRADRSATATALFTFTATSTVTSLILAAPGADGQYCEFDNVSVKEVMEFSNAIQFDGTDDFLDATYRSYYNAGSSTYIVATGSQTSGAPGFLTTETSTTNNSTLVHPLGVTAGNPTGTYYYIRNDANVSPLDYVNYAPGAVSKPSIISAVDFGNALKGYSGGVLTYTGAYARSGTLTTNKITIGAAQRIANGQFTKTIIALLCWAPGVMPDADRRAIERFGAYLIGEPHV